MMKRTQIYIEDDVWRLLRMKARQDRTTISDLVRAAVREKYLSSTSELREALLAAVGVWKDRSDLPDTQSYVRQLRKDSRPKRIVK